jgi:PhoPQ-activated pathogenicity-related protein
VKLWQATNPTTRDFRLETIGPVWESTPLAGEEGGEYLGKIKPPDKGWTAFFVELTYPGSGPAPFKFTTSVRVVPDTLPFKLETTGKRGGS